MGKIGAYKINYNIYGLHCAHCALKIENSIKQLPGLINAHLDFVNESLAIEIDDSTGAKKIEEDIQTTINNIESGVTIQKSTKDDINTQINGGNKRKLIQLVLGATLFITALFIKELSMLQLVFCATSYLILGGEVIWQAIKNVIKGKVFDENFLMALATIGAIIIGEYTEAVAVMLFYQVGEYLQEMAVDHSRRSIKDLMNICPDFANLKKGDNVFKIDPEEVKIGENILIKPGEKIPLDGIVLEGTSNIDTSPLTGESLPRVVKSGDEVMAGMINTEGVLIVEVTKVFSQSAVAKILDLVQNASAKKAKTERFITRFAKYYTPAVVIIAVFIAVLPPVLIPQAVFSQWLYRSLIFLVVSCPCALLVSIPLGFFGGIGGASKKGVLVKGGNYLETLNKVDTVVFDKTGTLTKGVFTIKEVVPSSDVSKEELHHAAVIAETLSNHPIALSIRNSWQGSISIEDIISYEEMPGIGVKVNYKGNFIFAGNHKIMNEKGINIENVKKGKTVVHVAFNDKYLGYLTLGDEIKKDSKKAIKELKNMGVQNLVMLTGDDSQAALETAEYLGLTGWFAELLPQDKVEIVENMLKEKSRKKKNSSLVYVGDGINDAPVLARADVGVAMGGLGSDAAIEAADVVIMNDQPSKLVSAIEIAKSTHRIVWQNIFLAFGVKALVLTLGVFGIATMWEAVFADVGVAILAVLNSIRILNK